MKWRFTFWKLLGTKHLYELVRIKRSDREKQILVYPKMMALLLRLLNRCHVSSASKLQNSLLSRLSLATHDKKSEENKNNDETTTRKEETQEEREISRIKNEVSTCLARRTDPNVLSELEFQSLSSLRDEMCDADARAQIDSIDSKDLVRTLLLILSESPQDENNSKDFCNITINALTLLTATLLFNTTKTTTLEYVNTIKMEFSFFDIMHAVCNRNVDSDSLDVINQFERVRRHAAECLRCLAKYSEDPSVFLIESVLRVKTRRTTRESFESLNEILKDVVVKKVRLQMVASCLCECLKHCYYNPVEDEEDECDDDDEEDEDINCYGTIALLRTFCLLGGTKACNEVAKNILDFLLYTVLFPGEGATTTARVFSEESRREAMCLVELLCSRSKERLGNFLKCVGPLIENIELPSEKSWTWSPSLESRSKSGFVGIVNLGCICYMNSMMQQLFMLSSFRDAILSLDASALMNKETESKKIEKKDNFLFQLQKMFLHLLYSKRKAYNPKDWCFAFKDSSNKNPTNVLLQQDTNEYMDLLVSRLDDVFKGTPAGGTLHRFIFTNSTCALTSTKLP